MQVDGVEYKLPVTGRPSGIICVVDEKGKEGVPCPNLYHDQTFGCKVWYYESNRFIQVCDLFDGPCPIRSEMVRLKTLTGKAMKK